MVATLLVLPLLAGFAGRAGAQPAHPLSGMDARPANPTCVAGEAPAPSGVRLRKVFPETDGFKPFHLQYKPDETSRWYFITRPGLLYTFRPERPNQAAELPTVALDLRGEVGILADGSFGYVMGGSEHWGLISFAFHPRFDAARGIQPHVFVMYNGRKAGETHATSYVVRYTIGSDGRTFDPASRLVILTQPQPDTWLHHFGHMMFAPDGTLMISSGDGWPNSNNKSLADPAQHPDALRGKMLRIDVDAATAAEPYRVPDGSGGREANPFVGVAGTRPEIWAIGFRNPWRFGMDELNGNLFVGDVGENTWEEVNFVEKGKNYGWNFFEGPDCYLRTPNMCGTPGLTGPISIYPQNGGIAAVIGGPVYRGRAIQSLVGKYVFSIYPRSEYYTLHRETPTGPWIRETLITGAPTSAIGFFNDADGELYGVSFVQFGRGGQEGVFQFVLATGDDPTIPARLSETGCVRPGNPQAASTGMIPFVVNSKLWSDGAQKRRWMALPDTPQVQGPEGRTTIRIAPDGDFDFPVGTILMKTFSYNNVPHETRLFERHLDGSWAGYTYAWRSDRSDADLVPAEGLTRTIVTNPSTGATIQWTYPSRGDCVFCHTPAAGSAIGPEVAQLNSVYRYSATRSGNQLATLNAIGVFETGLPAPVHDLPSFPDPQGIGSSTTNMRARAYLHENCSSCHRPGVAMRPTMDLRHFVSAQELNPSAPDRIVPLPVSRMRICNQPPLLDTFGLATPRLLAPRNPNGSVLFLRMNRRDDITQMPPIGTELVHGPGIDLMRRWISRPDVCTDVIDWDNDGIENHNDNCNVLANASQWDSDRDGFGNRCDADFDNNLFVDAADRSLLELAKGGPGATCADASFAVFGGSRYDEAYDLNVDGLINGADCAIYTALAGRAPGTSALRR